MIYIAFMIGLSGSLHCLGMCGPIAIALPVRTSDPFIKLLKYLLYNLGRVLTYATLGLLIGIVGKGFASAGLQQVLSIAAGVLIIASVLLVYNPFRFHVGNNGFITTIQSKIKLSFQYYLCKRGYSSLFIVGLLNGLLPCGMVYMAMLGALATGGPMSGAAFMAAFGLGTVPLMLAVSLTGNVVSAKVRSLFFKASPILGCIVGLMLIWRGANWEATSDGEGKNSCCKIEKCH
ncbi:MAG TPA: sulfite exporter TauE/SafE family protein [Cytophagaceae bacterium]|jgi:hypothetical protein